MNCKHHPDQDPASNKPIKLIGIQYKYHCPYCWKARAQWLEADSKRLDFAIEMKWLRRSRQAIDKAMGEL